MALKLVVEQKMAKIRAVFKEDAIHFVALPLEPVRPFQIGLKLLDGRIGFRHSRLDPDPLACGHVPEVDNDFQTLGKASSLAR